MTDRVLDKVYDPRQVEAKWYDLWLKQRLFHADVKSPKPKYTIVIPPPNVTGMLTMGHVLNNTLQDLLIRWKRMDGFEALWVPGMDHAGIATQNKVEASLKEQGTSRHDLGRDKLVEEVWRWKEKYGGIILKQLRRLGCSCDWERERFTMEERLSAAVREVFVTLFEKGLIYRGRRLINWCPRCQTALADEEAPAVDTDGKFWHLVYPVIGEDLSIIVSTTRPETMLGDTAVAVHPDDPRYQDLIGKSILLPLMNREIPIVADEYADPEKGSGAVKITPAHDFNDFEVAARHDLPLIQVMDDKGVMNENAGKYQGLDRFEVRKRILNDLAEQGFLKGEEPRVTPIPKCYRCDTVVEPYLSDQWFVRMKPLAEPAIQVVREGKIRFHPANWEETYFHWMENIRDWCISRQIWWGHRIPVWTCDKGHVHAHRTDPESCPTCGSTALEQDPDVLDTWFSSWLWPFSTLGWPEDTDDLRAFFPTDTLVTAPDIIFFWVARMIMVALEFQGDVPFRDVMFNGIVRDLAGRKMSKSLGNSPDPLWLIDGADAATVRELAQRNPSYKQGVPAYGADAVRMTMVYLTPLGGDVHFDHTLVEMGQKFCNKLWNASRFVLMNLGDAKPVDPDRDRLDTADRWIVSRLARTIRETRQGLDSFRFNDAMHTLYAFVWGEFCDWYIEFAKPRLFKSNDPDAKAVAAGTAVFMLDQILRLLHPVMPFITEEIWQALPKPADGQPTLMQSPFPVFVETWLDPVAEAEIELIQETIGAVRTIRSEMNVPPEKKASLLIRGGADRTSVLVRHESLIRQLASVSSIETGESLKRPPESAAAVVRDLEVFVPLEGLIDVALERQRLTKEIDRLGKLLEGLNIKLNNPEFTNRAPAQVVEKEKQKQNDFRQTLDRLRASLDVLGG
jgi:valyl-tRNA synthetase